MKKWVIFIIFILLSASPILLAGCSKESVKGSQAIAAISVNTSKARMGFLNDVTVISGKLEALESSNIVAKAPGKVAFVHVDIGDYVKAGQVLVTEDNKDLADRVSQAEAAVAQAEAGVSGAQAGLKQAEAGIKQSEAGVLAAEAGLATAEANFAVAKANYQRGQELLAGGAIPQAVFEGEYDLKYKQAKEQVEKGAPAQLDLARAQLSQAKTRYNQAQASLAQAQAGLKQAKASLALARSAYNDSFIKAPFSGVVTARNVNPGEMASPNLPIISIVNLDKVVVKAFVGEEHINEIKKGEQVKVKIKAISSQSFTGLITNIAPAADLVTKAFPVKIQIDNPKHLLKPGMFAEVELNQEQEESLLVPREAVVKDKQNKDVVWVVKKGVAKQRQVITGKSDNNSIIITSGLIEGEEIVIAGQESLRDGVRVNIYNH